MRPAVIAIVITFVAAVAAPFPWSPAAPAARPGTGGGEPPASPGTVPPGGPDSPPATRAFAVTILHSFTTVPKDLRALDIWIPVPLEDAVQEVFNRKTYAPYTAEFAMDDDTGNHFMYMKGGRRGGVPMKITMSLDLLRHEARRHPLLSRAEASPAPADPNQDRWLGSLARAVIDPSVTLRATRIVEGKGTRVERARAIYDWVVDSIGLLDRPEMHPGAGHGRLDITLRDMKGSSADMAAVFVSLCRAVKIPARSVTGYRIPPRERSGNLMRNDGWAEFRLDDGAWIPVDPAAASGAPAQRDFYFGGLDPDRIAISRGRDITLIPAQAGEPLNFFLGPYWEGNQKPMPSPATTIAHEHLDSIPAPQTIPLGTGAAEPEPTGPPGR